MPSTEGQYFDPEPTRKKSKPRDCIDQMCTYVNQELLISKLFYFFFFAAFGSLFPLLAVYFKQLGMNATQSGMLIGFRPFIEFLSAPFWGNLADKWRKGKQIMLFALFSWVAFTLALAFIQPTVDSCLARNHTGHTIREDPLDRDRRDTGTSYFMVPQSKEFQQNKLANLYNKLPSHILNKRMTQYANDKAPVHVRHKRDENEDVYLVKKEDKVNLSPPEEIGKSPVDMGNGRVSPAHSSIVYKEQDVREVFFLLLLVVVIGEFFSAPAITLGDSCTLAYLGDDVDNYGRQRMFGSLGWGLAMFFVGIALDHSTTFPEHPCAQQDRSEKNYTICFAVFSVLMSCAFIAATQFRFMYNGQEENIPLAKIPGKMKKKAKDMIDGVHKIKHKRLVEDEDSDDAFEQDSQQDYTRADDTQSTPEGEKPPLEIKLEKDRDMVYDAMQTQENLGLYEQPKWLHVFRLFCNLRYGSFLFLAWFMGFGIGLIFTFLFWHLQDLGGSPTLFGMASVINHISEILAYFFSSRLISQIGHVRLLYIGLVGNVARFLYISWLKSPWWVLPFEFAQGVTHALVWAASVSYITNATPAHLKHSAQGILQGLHHGLGRGCGAVFGGIMVHYLGSEWTFRIYGFLCIAVLVFFVAANYFSSDVQTPADFLNQDKHEPKEYVEETSTLAPCGVPMNPMSRNLSNSKLAGMESEHQGYGATQDASNGYLQPGDRHSDPWNSSQNGYQAGGQGLFMSASPPVQTEMHYQQPEGNQKETQYQYDDNW